MLSRKCTNFLTWNIPVYSHLSQYFIFLIVWKIKKDIFVSPPPLRHCSNPLPMNSKISYMKMQEEWSGRKSQGLFMIEFQVFFYYFHIYLNNTGWIRIRMDPTLLPGSGINHSGSTTLLKGISSSWCTEFKSVRIFAKSLSVPNSVVDQEWFIIYPTYIK